MPPTRTPTPMPLPRPPSRITGRAAVLAVALTVLALAAGCAQGGGDAAGAARGSTAGSQSSSTTSSTSTSTTSAGTQPSSPASLPRAVPVIFVHGITSDPVENWGALLPRLARGRQLFPEIYAAETDALPTGGVRPDSLFGFGFYRESASSPKYYTDRAPALPSIGGCPWPRTDAMAGRYSISFAAQLDRAVENVCRATGSERVDLVCYSLGGIVGRAYTRWLSLKAPGGGSRVRRLLTVGTMNHGLNSLEATTLVLARGSAGPHLAQGEAAELNYQCTYWSGRSFIDLLDDGWDAFCAHSGVEYAAAYGRGNSIFDSALLQTIMTALGPSTAGFMSQILVHPTPGFDAQAAGAEAMEDGDGVVRVSSSRMDPARFPGVRFNTCYYGTHSRTGQDVERALFSSTWLEELVRRFIFEGRTWGGASGASGSVRLVEAGGEAGWLALDLDVPGGEPLAAQVLLRTRFGQLLAPFAPSFGVGTYALALPLRSGRQTLMLDPTGVPDQTYGVEVRLFGIDSEVAIPASTIRLARSGRRAAPQPLARIGAITVNAAGGIDVAVSVSASASAGSAAGGPTSTAAQGTGEVLWALDDGSGGVWSGPVAAGVLSLPALTPGDHELRVRAVGAPNAAGISVESATPATVRFQVSPAGIVVRP